MSERGVLAGKAALVTGASRGIGKAIALRLGADGADLALVQRGDAAETVAALGRDAVVERCDLQRAEDAELAVERAFQRLGRLDICVCNAGSIQRQPALDVAIEDFRRIIELNLVSTFAVARAAARHMAEGGSIVLVASVLAFQGGVRVPA
jgi:2-deoxy-D-gluconate 3-dehydrogenase